MRVGPGHQEMHQQILDALIPNGVDAGKPLVRRLCLAALLLFPLALAVAFLLLIRTEPKPPIRVTLNGPKAVAIALQFAQSQGIATQTWTADYGYAVNNSLLAFANRKDERRPLWATVPPMYGTVKMTNRAKLPAAPDTGQPQSVQKQPGERQSGAVYVSLDGKVVGFEWKNLPSPGSPLSDEQALRLAASRLPASLNFRPPAIDRKGDDRTYTFHSSSVRDVDIKALATVTNNRLTAFRLSAEPDAFARSDDAKKLQLVLSMAGFILCVVVALYSVYRYASRSMQQEVSHSRSITVAALCACFCIVLALNIVVNGEMGSLPFYAILVVFAVMGLLGGGLLAAAYGSGEGDVREAYPGKLTSLDVMLTGKVFSQNVGVSLLFGMVCASWLSLALALIVASSREASIRAPDMLIAPLMRVGFLAPFVLYPLASLAFAAAGLLQPLAALNRYFGKARRWHLPVLLLCGVLVAGLRSTSASNTEYLAVSVALVLALIVPFFYCDLLAALACLSGVFAVLNLSSYIAALPEAQGSLYRHLAAAVFAVVFALWSIRKGKKWEEEQVRPVYARHIAERKALEAEVSAAREAQLRLLPQSVPDLAGLTIAAACVPAETVGGDFYDFFTLGDGRLGIFIAEGNSRGLAAALTIALAKGYLMHCVEKYRDPVEVLSRLETALSSIFDEEAGCLTDFAFASIDTGTGELRYARTGVYPKVVVASSGDNRVFERLVPVKGRHEPLAEGSALLAPGDRVMLFTDGIGRRIAANENCNAEEAAGKLSRKDCQALQELLDRFFAVPGAMFDPDDLTLIVLQTESEDAAALWGAA